MILNITGAIDELAEIPAVVDPFCEKRFWEDDQHTKLPISNPVSAATGIVIMLMAIFTSNIRYPPNKSITRSSVITFHLCRASLGIVGAGTFVFHAIDDTQSDYKKLNFRMCDWLPIVLMCNNILVLYITKFERDASERLLSFIFVSMYVWTCVLVLAVDSTTYEYMSIRWHKQEDSQNLYGTIMNVVLLVPLGLTLATASFLHFNIRQSAIIWGCIAVNLVLWIGNAYGCNTTLWLSMLHAIYHVTIAYTFLWAACLGMTIDNEWTVQLKYCIWPMIEPSETLPKGILNSDPQTKSEAIDTIIRLAEKTRKLNSWFTPSETENILTGIRIESLKSV